MTAKDAGLGFAERAAFGVQPCLILGRHRGVEPSGDVPAEGAAKSAALAHALGRAARQRRPLGLWIRPTNKSASAEPSDSS
jgi:hypothetical protein